MRSGRQAPRVASSERRPSMQATPPLPCDQDRRESCGRLAPSPSSDDPGLQHRPASPASPAPPFPHHESGRHNEPVDQPEKAARTPRPKRPCRTSDQTVNGASRRHRVHCGPTSMMSLSPTASLWHPNQCLRGHSAPHSSAKSIPPPRLRPTSSRTFPCRADPCSPHPSARRRTPPGTVSLRHAVVPATGVAVSGRPKIFCSPLRPRK